MAGRSTRSVTSFFRLGLAVWVIAVHSAAAAGPPCRPCAGVRVENPRVLLEELAAEPRLEGEARLYVSWTVGLDGSDAGSDAAAVAATGAIPWLRLRFRTPAPLTSHLERLEEELAAASAIARAAGSRAHLQILWRPESPPVPEEFPQEYSFLLKRATVAVTGAFPDARVISQPLPADPDLLAALYAEDVAAYLDGVALEALTAEQLAPALDALGQLDPGKAVVLDALAFPSDPFDTLAEAARRAVSGVAVTFFDLGNSPAASVAPLKILAREFQGDLSFDPYSTPSGDLEAWSFVRGEDLGLRVIVQGPGEAATWKLTFSDPQLRGLARVDPTTGEAHDLFGAIRTRDGLELELASPDPVTLLRFERLTASEIEGIEGLEEEVTVVSERQLPVEEILRRLQAFEDDQSRRLRTYQARNTTHLRFQIGTGGQSIEITFQGPFFFRRDTGFDWAWREFYVNGVKWRSKTIPEIPLIQPEKAATLPVEITFTKEYRYRLRGTGTVHGRDCWVVDFEPAVPVEPGRSLYRGTVWVDRQIYARVQTRAVQLGLEGDVLSNEETLAFSPVDAAGQPGPWDRTSYFLPLRLVGQQIWSILSATTVVEREILLTDIEINQTEFDQRRQAVLDSELTMVRDTDLGLRYLVLDKETGQRILKEELDQSRRFVVAGVFQDESLDFPVPLAGINWLWFDWRGTGTQANVFFAGALANVAVTNPKFLGSKFDVGFDAFAFAIAGTNQIFRDGRQADEEDVKRLNPNIDLKVGRPFGNFFKLDFQYQLGYANFSRADETADDFVLPSDHLHQTFSLTGRYNRKGYRLRVGGSHTLRDEWEPWGLPGSDDFDPVDKEYTQWRFGLGKTWHLPKFLKFGAEIEYVDGSHLDRFSKYEFGFFSDIRVHGYQSDKVRAEEAWGAHLTYGFDVGELFRLDLVGDAAWATDEASGLDQEFLAGVGLVGTLVGPWQTVLNVDLGTAVAGPDDGFSFFLAVLKLFR